MGVTWTHACGAGKTRQMSLHVAAKRVAMAESGAVDRQRVVSKNGTVAARCDCLGGVITSFSCEPDVWFCSSRDYTRDWDTGNTSMDSEEV